MRTGVEKTTNLSDIAQYKQTLQITDRAYTQPKNTLDDVCINVSFNLRLRACAAHHMSESTCFCVGFLRWKGGSETDEDVSEYA